MSKPFIFKIDEIGEEPTSSASFCSSGSWIPSELDHVHAAASIFCGLVGIGSALQLEDCSQPTNYWRFLCNDSSTSNELPIFLALVAFASSMTQLYYLHKRDHHQQRYLVGGLTTGILYGLASERDLQRAMLNVMPWSILLSLVLSIAAHVIWHTRIEVEVVDETSVDWGLSDEKHQPLPL
ncbi:hypothetical protein IQ06DRAFT_292523 [Phaeosphaeriaceae sp. SRC1lsM3a]|nr:hypothetical protein IQ06DRAFT_292523 [Stagonospora sp. SRC1lsM3a]